MKTEKRAPKRKWSTYVGHRRGSRPTVNEKKSWCQFIWSWNPGGGRKKEKGLTQADLHPTGNPVESKGPASGAGPVIKCI